ncbi:MAG: hypothetical protein D6705_12865 [Deltaproteobacteria bacterium]|nr:MAG: hypothetical protein D6705_12865 [Deltaproteobacteria bacterium]
MLARPIRPAPPGTSPRWAWAGRVAGIGALVACVACHPSTTATADDPQPHQDAGETVTAARPRLVVVVAVDQMPSRIVERYGARWTGGLRRVLDEGVVTLDGWHRHAGTFTAAGHATLATGRDPREHGFVANRWWDRDAWTEVDVVADPEVKPVGVEDGRPLSPVHLLTEGLADWFEAADPRAHTVGVGLKDRAVIGLSGRHPDLAVWLDRNTGRWVTSTWYADALPPFVARAEVARRARELLGDGWTVLRGDPDEPVPDRVLAEADRVHVTFPHRTKDLLAWDGTVEAAIRATPFGDTLVADLAVAAVEQGSLGRDDVPDLLCVAFSSTDYVGHRFGPDSREIVDTYDRLDADLARLFDALDTHVGRDRYVLLLTSDHGVTPLPEHAGGRRILPSELVADAERAVAELRRTDEAIARLPQPRVAYRDGVYFGFDAAVPNEARAKIRAAAAEALRRREDVADVFTWDELSGAAPPKRRFGRAVFRSFHPERSPDLWVVPAKGSLVIDYPGTTHGTPYAWDRQVPIAVVGPGIEPARTALHVETVLVAPLLAHLAGVRTPSDLPAATGSTARAFAGWAAAVSGGLGDGGR